jgi:hypothetical protein
MKRVSILLTVLFIFNAALPQETDLSAAKILADNTNKTLKAATIHCALSFVFEGAGAGLILADIEEPEAKFFSGVILGWGGVGIAIGNLTLTNRAYKQIRMMGFTLEESTLRIKMLKNIKTARTLAIIQNITPFVAVAAGTINYFLIQPEVYEDFYVASSFWIPVVSICCIGMLLNIPEIVLIEKTRGYLSKYQQKFTLGTTKHGMGISYKF